LLLDHSTSPYRLFSRRERAQKASYNHGSIPLSGFDPSVKSHFSLLLRAAAFQNRRDAKRAFDAVMPAI
jgi:hypothetical protein